MKTFFFFFALSFISLSLSAQVTDTIVAPVDGAGLHAVLTQPSAKNACPLAIIIAGSGPTDLNGNQPNMKNNSLKYLSDELVKNNIATFRFDKRGIGKSSYPGFSEASLTFDRYVKDAALLIDFCKKKGFSDIYVIGHSEGSLIGMLATQIVPVKGFISVSGPGSPADVILKDQLKPKLPPAFYLSVEAIIDSLKNGMKVKNVSPQLNILFRPSVQPYLISWFNYAPAEQIAKLTCPVIILQGDKDIQVGPDEAKKLATASKNSKLVIIQNMNHLLKTIVGEMPENLGSYTNPDLPVNSELVKNITDFITKKHEQ